MSIRRKIKTKLGFRSGKLSVVRIEEVNEKEIILGNGSVIKVLDSWRKNLDSWKNPLTDQIDYTKNRFSGMEVYTILNQGRFTGILVEVHTDGDKLARHVLGVKPPIGWSGGCHIEYCQKIMADDFGAWSELAMSL